jgi:hypothetical protein
MLRTRLMVLAVLAAALALPGVAPAQGFGPDVYTINYFDNAHNSSGLDATVRIINPGTDPFGDRCALTYVFDSAQELKECCGCRITPNGLLTLSVDNNLTSNVVGGGTVNRGVIKIVSTLPSSGTTAPKGSDAGCDPGAFAVVAGAGVPTPALRAWATHLQPSGITAVPFLITETAFQDATLGAHEYSVQLAVQCAIIEGAAGIVGGLGSGTGLCNCTSESTPW